MPDPHTYILISTEDLEQIKLSLQKILHELLKQKTPHIATGIRRPFITAIEFMQAVTIKRTKFDELVAKNKIKIIKKKRKIYVPFEEIENYFKNPSIK
jgi:hypothetical protein